MKTLTLTFIVVAIVLLVVMVVAVAGISLPKSFGYGMSLVAEELTEKPEEYILLVEPDPYVLQAVSNLGEEVVVGAWEDSEFDEMVSSYGTNNVEIDGKYYRIQVYAIDAFFWGGLFWLSIVGWAILGIAAVVNTLKLKITKR